MLAVVGRRRRVSFALGQGLDRAAERWASLEEGHVVARVDQVERGGEPGQPAADHDRLHSAATAFAFSSAESRGGRVEHLEARRAHPREKTAE